MTEKKEGSLLAPTRDIVDWKNPDYLDEFSLDAEMRRQFEVCHSCRRCFNLCDSFPKLFKYKPLSRLRIKKEVYKNSIGDNSLVIKEFKFKPSINIDEGIRKA